MKTTRLYASFECGWCINCERLYIVRAHVPECTFESSCYRRIIYVFTCNDIS